jgi:hypothetical protein
VISIRWLVVRAAAPVAQAAPGTAQAHPPGPGFPEHAPSVYTVVGTGRRLPVSGGPSRARMVFVSGKPARDWMA